MAVTIQRVLADIGSDEVRLTREQVNLITNFIDLFKAGVAGAVDFAAFKVAVAALDTTGLRNLVAEPNIPAPPRFPTG